MTQRVREVSHRRRITCHEVVEGPLIDGTSVSVLPVRLGRKSLTRLVGAPAAALGFGRPVGVVTTADLILLIAKPQLARSDQS
jgi:hypothetical protein